MLNGQTTFMRYKYLLVWILQSAVVITLVVLNPNHYTTPDSAYYLQSAQSLLDGDGYTIRENGQQVWNGTFPIGYPLLIAVISWISQLPVLWSSKIANLLCSALLILLFRKWYGGEKGLFFSCILLLGPFLKLWAHTWSEPLFLLVLCILTRLLLNPDSSFSYTLFAGIALILIRYAGVFIIPMALTYGIYLLYRNQASRAYKLGALSAIWFVAFLCYLGVNSWQSGAWYGGSRFSHPESFSFVARLFGRGLINELLLVRDWGIGETDALFWTGIAAQVTILLWILKSIKKQDDNHIIGSKAVPTFCLAISYLLFLFSLRLISPFDPPGYRLLAPFTFLTLQSVLHLGNSTLTLQRLGLPVALLIAFSWLDLIPQHGLHQKLRDRWIQELPVVNNVTPLAIPSRVNDKYTNFPANHKSGTASYIHWSISRSKIYKHYENSHY